MIHSYPWYMEDWRGSQARLLLNLEERALYRELLDYCYIERSLTTDERSLARIANCSDEEFKRAWPNVQKLFNESNGRYFHSKVTEVLEKLDGYHNQRSLAGKASGERRRNGKGTSVGSAVQFSLPKNATKNEPSLTSSSTIDKKEAPPTPSESKNGFHKKLTTTDDKQYATDRDALVAMVREGTGRKPDVKLIRKITESLEVRGGTVAEYLADIRPRIPRLRHPPGEGFFLGHAQKWGGEQTTPAPEPETADQQKARTGPCEICKNIGMVNGEYCICKMAEDLRKADQRKKPPAAAS